MQRSFEMFDYDLIVGFFSLLSKKRGSRFGLDCITSLCNALNNPQRAFKSIHIAGTNGKGSTATKIAKALTYEGYTVGLFTSPHISTIRERFVINGETISKDDFSKLFQKVHSVSLEHNLEPTYFEYCTALGFLYFQEKNVDYAVLETGLGGRLDATTICVPLLTVITSISLDHTDILGTTIEKIAHEKAGIIKSNVPCVIGPTVPYDIIKSVASKLSAQLYSVTAECNDYELENTEIARLSLQVLSEKIPLSLESIKNGIKAVPPLRFERLKSLDVHAIIIDVGHNPDGIKRLFERVHREFGQRKITSLFGTSKEKDVQAALALIVQESNAMCFIQANSERACNAQDLYVLAHELDDKKEKAFFFEIEKGLKWALAHTDKESLLLIFGSFFIMSDIRKLLGLDQEVDLHQAQESISTFKACKVDSIKNFTV